MTSKALSYAVTHHTANPPACGLNAAKSRVAEAEAALPSRDSGEIRVSVRETG
ncbi:hypothetical protein BDW71DRAFT_172141 [Aspergillus fruticulosus]